MFLVIIFLALAALLAYFLPDWSWASILLLSFGTVAAFRLYLLISERAARTSSDKDAS